MPAATRPQCLIPPAPLPLLQRVWRLWRRAWASPPIEHDAPYLAEAADLVDLEQRLRRLERGRPDRFGPLPR